MVQTSTIKTVTTMKLVANCRILPANKKVLVYRLFLKLVAIDLGVEYLIVNINKFLCIIMVRKLNNTLQI